jgi:hypothetical protein
MAGTAPSGRAPWVPDDQPGQDARKPGHNQRPRRRVARLPALSSKPEPLLFVLNSAVEHQMLVDMLADWALPAESPGSAAADIPRLADAAQRLVRNGMVKVYLDPLEADELLLLDQNQALSAVADAENWWREESDETAEPATSVFALSITEKGRTALASFAKPQPGSRPWRNCRSS